jgi:hypothetical protein
MSRSQAPAWECLPSSSAWLNAVRRNSPVGWANGSIVDTRRGIIGGQAKRRLPTLPDFSLSTQYHDPDTAILANTWLKLGCD